jgi:hypothetical protein
MKCGYRDTQSELQSKNNKAHLFARLGLSLLSLLADQSTHALSGLFLSVSGCRDLLVQGTFPILIASCPSFLGWSITCSLVSILSLRPWLALALGILARPTFLLDDSFALVVRVVVVGPRLALAIGCISSLSSLAHLFDPSLDNLQAKITI